MATFLRQCECCLMSVQASLQN